MSREVCKFDLQGNFIKLYESIKEASKDTGIHNSNITRVCKIERRQTNNFIWR